MPLDTLAFRCGEVRRRRFMKLAERAGKPNPSQLFNAIADQLHREIGERPNFDVRDIRLVSRSSEPLASGDSGEAR